MKILHIASNASERCIEEALMGVADELSVEARNDALEQARMYGVEEPYVQAVYELTPAVKRQLEMDIDDN